MIKNLFKYVDENWKGKKVENIKEIEIAIIKEIADDENLTAFETIYLLNYIEKYNDEFRKKIQCKYDNKKYKLPTDEQMLDNIEELKNNLITKVKKRPDVIIPKQIRTPKTPEEKKIFLDDFYNSFTNVIEEKIELGKNETDKDVINKIIFWDNILHTKKNLNLLAYSNIGRNCKILKEINFFSTDELSKYFVNNEIKFINGNYTTRYLDKAIKFSIAVDKFPDILKSTFSYNKIIDNIKIIEEFLCNKKWQQRKEEKQVKTN